MPAGDVLRPLVRDIAHAPAAERAALGILGSFSVTVSAARAVNLVRERARPAPSLRSRVRRTVQGARPDGPRIHHYVPGVALAMCAGAAGILTREDGPGLLLSLPFGTGLGLTADEVGLLVRRDNPYWGTEALSAVEAAVAAVGAAAFVARAGARR